MNETKVITVNVRLASDVGEFSELCSTTNGKIMLVRDDTRIPASSKLGVISICDGKPFNMVFTDCSDEEILKFKRFECYNQEDENNSNQRNDISNIIISYSNEEI